MTAFPTDLPAPGYGLSGQAVLHQVRTPFEAGYVQSRPRHTRSRKKYSLSYHLRNTTELEVLLDFFADNQGGSFTYAWLGDGDYRFSGDEVHWDYDDYNRLIAKIEIEEL